MNGISFRNPRDGQPEIPYGQYTGSLISELPTDYLRNMVTRSDITNELKVAASKELDLREAGI